MEYTEQYNLKKPADDDTINVQDLDNNFDAIDMALSEGGGYTVTSDNGMYTVMCKALLNLKSGSTTWMSIKMTESNNETTRVIYLLSVVEMVTEQTAMISHGAIASGYSGVLSITKLCIDGMYSAKLTARMVSGTGQVYTLTDWAMI